MYRLPFLKLWNQAVALRVIEAVADAGPLGLLPQDVASPAGCRVGQWIAAQGADTPLARGVGELDRCHRLFHLAAEEIVRARLAGTSGAALDAFRHGLDQAAQAVTSAIDALEQKAPWSAPAPSRLGTDPFWSDTLNIGIPIVDAQHRAIAALAYNIARHPDAALISEKGTDFLTDFHQVVAEHFDTEERLMKQSPLPEAAQRAHIEEHSALLERIVAYNFDETRRHGHRRVAEIMDDLSCFVVDHVVDWDSMLKPRGR